MDDWMDRHTEWRKWYHEFKEKRREGKTEVKDITTRSRKEIKGWNRGENKIANGKREKINQITNPTADFHHTTVLTFDLFYQYIYKHYPWLPFAKASATWRFKHSSSGHGSFSALLSGFTHYLHSKREKRLENNRSSRFHGRVLGSLRTQKRSFYYASFKSK
jgi:hypothetical protein